MSECGFEQAAARGGHNDVRQRAQRSLVLPPCISACPKQHPGQRLRFVGTGRAVRRIGRDRAAASHALRLLKAMGRRPWKDGKLIEDDDKATAFLAENMKPILEEFVPTWRRLGVLAS